MFEGFRLFFFVPAIIVPKLPLPPPFPSNSGHGSRKEQSKKAFESSSKIITKDLYNFFSGVNIKITGGRQR